jgi:hypothetical protein
MLKTWFGEVRTGAAALLVAAAAIGLAILWLEVAELAAVAAVVVAALIGGGAAWVGERALAGERPRPLRALTWLTCSVLVPLSVGAAAAAVIIVLGIELPGDRVSDQTRALITSATGAVGTYLGTAFIRGAEDADAGWIGGVVKQAFQTTFRGRFEENTPARNAVFSDVAFQGWDRVTRRKRAQAIEDALAKQEEQKAAASAAT